MWLKEYESKTRIYGLFHPLTKECFYIGKTKKCIYKRYLQHVYETTIKSNKLSKKEEIILQLLNEGLKPEIKEIYRFNDYYDKKLKITYCEYVEHFYIYYYKKVLKQPLTNTHYSSKIDLYLQKMFFYYN